MIFEPGMWIYWVTCAYWYMDGVEGRERGLEEPIIQVRNIEGLVREMLIVYRDVFGEILFTRWGWLNIQVVKCMLIKHPR